MIKNQNIFFLPPPQKFFLVYKKQNGQIKDYVISAPIEANDHSFTCYAFQKGLRSFKISGVRELKLLKV